MKYPFYILTALMVLASCGNSPNNKIDTETEQDTDTVAVKPLTLQDLKKDFKFFNLTEFEMDKFNFETRPGKYKELDSTTFYMVWQDGKREFIGQYYDRDYLFSWQDRDTNFIEFTILTQHEESWCNVLYYCIFDKNGKFIDKFLTASSCGDGGWTFCSWGKFINKKTYEMLSVESQLVFLDEDDERYNEDKEFYEGDSTLYHFIINDKGKVTQKEIFKKHFTEELEYE